jgi:hypothetical protein
MAATVADKSPAILAMEPDWQLAAALMGGTRAMRAAKTAYLPKWPNEDQRMYDTRVATATLYPAYQQTVETLAAKPFSKPLTIGEDVPAQIKEWTEDIDLEGRNLHVFGSDLMESALGEGLGGILVDYPTRVRQNADGTTVAIPNTQAAEKAAGLRPYMVHIKAEQLIDCQAARVDGKWRINHLRFSECVQEPDPEDRFATIEVAQIRVLEPGTWETWRKKKNAAGTEEWQPHQEGVTTLQYVPFFPVYGKRTGFMMGKPPMIELGHQNVKHWQSQSDQDTLLHIARVPILVRTGMQDTVMADGTLARQELVIGSSAAVDLPKDATLEYCEHTGSAIGAGKASLDDLKDEMRQTGAEMLVIKPGNSTRIEAASDNIKGMCALQRVALGLQDALNTALQCMADWVKLPSGGHVAIFMDFGALTLEAAVADLISLQQGGILSKETTFKEAQRRGTVSADVDFDEEQERISQEGPPLGTMGEDIDPATGKPRKTPAAE